MNMISRTIAAAVLAVGLAIPAAPAASAQQIKWDSADTVDTKWGPRTKVDRDLIAKVRLAGLWEGPTALEGTQRGTARRVREVGAQLHADHSNLDDASFKIAQQLTMTLPDEATSEQAAWMAEIHGEPNGDSYDRAWVNRLRVAHGRIFLQIASARAGTRNDLVRDFATTANFFVDKHMTLLESTNMVDSGALAVPTIPTGPASSGRGSGSAVAQRALSESTATNLGMTILLSVALVGALAFGGIMILRRMSRRA